MDDSVSAAPFPSTFSSFLLTHHFEKVSWPYPSPQRKAPGWKPGEGKLFSFHLCSHHLQAVVHTAVVCQPPWCPGRLSATDGLEECFVSDFMPFTSCFSRYLLDCLTTALPLACQSTWSLLSLLGHIFMTLGQRGNWDICSPTHLSLQPPLR